MTVTEINAAISAGLLVTGYIADCRRPKQPRGNATVVVTKAFCENGTGRFSVTGSGYVGRFHVKHIEIWRHHSQKASPSYQESLERGTS